MYETMRRVTGRSRSNKPPIKLHKERVIDLWNICSIHHTPQSPVFAPGQASGDSSQVKGNRSWTCASLKQEIITALLAFNPHTGLLQVSQISESFLRLFYTKVYKSILDGSNLSQKNHTIVDLTS